MKTIQMQQPQTNHIFKSSFVIPSSLIKKLEELELAGVPDGKWAEWTEGKNHNLQLRVYYPENFVAGTKGVVSLQTHTNPQGRVQKRITFRRFLATDFGLQEQDSNSIAFRINDFLKNVEPYQSCDNFEKNVYEAFGIEISEPIDAETIEETLNA